MIAKLINFYNKWLKILQLIFHKKEKEIKNFIVNFGVISALQV